MTRLEAISCHILLLMWCNFSGRYFVYCFISTSFRIQVDILHVINLNPQENLKCVLFQCFFYCKKYT